MSISSIWSSVFSSEIANVVSVGAVAGVDVVLAPEDVANDEVVTGAAVPPPEDAATVDVETDAAVPPPVDAATEGAAAGAAVLPPEDAAVEGAATDDAVVRRVFGTRTF